MEKIKFMNIGSNALPGIILKQKEDSSYYNYLARTPYGTYIEIYTKDDGDLNINYPQNTATATVYIKNSCP